eukprot:CAMPEP_0204603426 /NCGR_PEP_ID=MMETSP0661-20131031/57258_1 /ASSEMBLY_ACC=CAM_ASM_000606 /TAXON_ID=109239 /ORGANISM="Alexandrium margalefi, Strain AMGDE01CS-322" /LENGTH=226 /DNA_ID=CAMNT_0051614483 /DNA_START=17 /DNA_END=697 /DNA_ORIENTATION=+
MSVDIFNGAQRVVVKQEFAPFEMCSCEARNRYRISKPAEGDREGPGVFLFVDDDSDSLAKLCCSVNRDLVLNVHQGATKDGPVVLSMWKPFHLQNLCFCRPRFEVYSGPKTGTRIGVVEDPFSCCSIDQEVRDSDSKLVFTSSGSLLQPGLCFPCWCGVDFDILRDGRKVGSVSKTSVDFCEFVKKTNRFVVDFGDLRDPAEKRMAFATAMLLDLQFFEENKATDG